MWRANTRARCRLVVVAVLAAVAYPLPAVALAAEETRATVVSLPVGAQVAGLAVGADAVWVANARAGTVARLDPKLNQVIATIRVAEPSPTCDRCWGAVAARGDIVWAAIDAAGPVVVRIDPSSNQIAETVEVGVLPSALAVDDGGALWLTATLENTVARVDPHGAGAVTRTAVHLPSGIVTGPEAVWVTARKPGATGQVVRIDRRTGVVVATIPVGRDPGALAVSDADVWLANETDHTLSRIDMRANRVVAIIPVAALPVGVAIGSDAVWVASHGFALASPPAVSRIDPSGNTVVATTPLDAAAPIGMDAGEGSLWVASRNPDAVVRIGPVPLPARLPTPGGPPLLPVTLGLGMILLLSVGEVLRRSAYRGRQRPVATGRVLDTLLVWQQARLRVGACGPRPACHHPSYFDKSDDKSDDLRPREHLIRTPPADPQPLHSAFCGFDRPGV